MIKTDSKGFLLCPCCGKKTKTKILANTKLIHFPLFCPWCKQEQIIDI